MLTDLCLLWQVDDVDNVVAQVHLKERMHALEEKNQLSNEVQRMRKSLEDIGNQKVVIMIIVRMITVLTTKRNPKGFFNFNVIKGGQIQLLILKESQTKI